MLIPMCLVPREQALAAYSKCAELTPAGTSSGELSRKIKSLQQLCKKQEKKKQKKKNDPFAGFSEGRGKGPVDLLEEMLAGGGGASLPPDPSKDPASWCR